nr:hypothetical protein Iba_chr04cCG15210 [Ipomoea batatas]
MNGIGNPNRKGKSLGVQAMLNCLIAFVCSDCAMNDNCLNWKLSYQPRENEPEEQIASEEEEMDESNSDPDCPTIVVTKAEKIFLTSSLDQRRPVVKITEIEWRNLAEKEKVTLIGKFVNERPPLDMFRTKFQKDFSITGSDTHWINQYKACSDLILTGRGLQKDFSKRSGVDREQVSSVLGVVAEVVNGYPCSGCSSIYHHRSTTEEVALAPNGVGAIGPPKGDAKAHDGSEAKHCDGDEAEHCDGL